MRRLPVIVVGLALVLAGCASVLDPTKDWTAEQFYEAAKEQLDSKNYEEAIKLYEQLQGRYPYGRHAEQAQLETAYAYYKFDEPALAIAACDRFIRQFPTHPYVDYAYYLKGLVNFRGMRSVSNWLFESSDELLDRDPRASRESFESFKELVQRFPNSRYAEDARLRMVYLFEAQAHYEVSVAKFYLGRGAFVAAANRAKYTLENYPRTPATEDALGIQALAYQKMGLTTLRDDTVRVLKRNFPDSAYLKRIETGGEL